MMRPYTNVILVDRARPVPTVCVVQANPAVLRGPYDHMMLADRARPVPTVCVVQADAPLARPY